MTDSGQPRPEGRHVPVVYAHPNPNTFTRAVRDEVVRGLGDGGSTYEVLDLYAMGFDPVFSQHDSSQFIHPTAPLTDADRDALAQALVDGAGNPIKRLVARRWVRGRSLAELVQAFQDHQPADVRAHQAKVAAADALHHRDRGLRADRDGDRPFAPASSMTVKARSLPVPSSTR